MVIERIMPKKSEAPVRVTLPSPGVLLYCQHADCGVGIDMGAFIAAGTTLMVPPSLCPRCARETTWDALKPWTVTTQDEKLFMHPRGIVNDEKP